MSPTACVSAYDAAAQAALPGETVLAATPAARPGGWGPFRRRAAREAGGLPARFVLVVTPGDVVALAARPLAGDVLLRRSRAGLGVQSRLVADGVRIAFGYAAEPPVLVLADDDELPARVLGALAL